MHERRLAGIVDGLHFEHLRRIVLPEEGAQGPHGFLGLREQVFVAQFEILVRRQAAGLDAAFLDVAFPVFGGEISVVDAEVMTSSEQRQRDVAAVAYQVHEARVRKPFEQFLHVHDVVGRLVAPARLALAARILLEEAADDRRHRVPALCVKLLGEARGVEAHAVQVRLEKIAALRVHRVEHGAYVFDAGQVAELRPVAVKRNEKMRFASRQRDAWQVAQPVLQHRRARARRADDEDGAVVVRR
ncbi:hypothetical protein Tbd_0307 [Thiobacillus denitrificans ATCC 25259]|uniref:Uncharacterized protein n=1 Tax=Thiobacillus denitrificans (strain ATCC 25259 / T1) TaxID=292415 RepID=Q3SLZ2_THIDA|nr:hypothetical protein Tbd_0307 [Thiobacillus denitrificans ATCC 25259]